jgi:hypothetical protein
LVNHSIKSRKKHPTIADMNDLLKSDTVIDIPTWRQIQRLGDIRNLCDHNRNREPSQNEVEELIAGVSKVKFFANCRLKVMDCAIGDA